MHGFDMTKKEIADYCRETYLDDSLTKKQVTDRLRNFINRHLQKIGVVKQTHKAGGLVEDDYMLRGDEGIHGVSHHLRQWIDAIMALEMKHHLVDKHIDKAAKDLAEFIPDLDKQLRHDMPLQELRDRLTVLRKNEKRSVVKKLLGGIRIEHHAYYLLQPVYEWSRKVATANDGKNLTKKVSSQIKVNPDFAVAEAGRLVREGIEKKSQEVKYSLALGLAIATGRRRSEIFKSAKFWATETTPDGHVMFSGQLKTHDRQLFDDVKPYPIPTLISPQLVIDGLKVLRKLQRTDLMRYQDVTGAVLDGVSPLDEGKDDLYHNRAVGAYYAHSANEVIRKVFDNPHLEWRHSRDMYSAIGYQQFKRPGEAESVYRTRVYGHATAGSGSGDSQKHYEKFELDTSIEKAAFLSGSGPKQTGANRQLVAALTAKDAQIEQYLRAPNMKMIHAWLKEQLDLGLSPEKVTPYYIRRYCLINGKGLRQQTCQAYLDEQIEWAKLVAEFPAEPLPERVENDEDEEAPEDQGQDAEEKAGPVHKPRVAVVKDGDGWRVTITLGDSIEHDRRYGLSRMDAMKAAWADWEDSKAPPKPRISKEAGGWRVRLEKGGQVVLETWQKGTQKQAIDAAMDEWIKAKK